MPSVLDLSLYATPQMLIKIGSKRRLNVRRTGKGSPTVLLAHGLGSSTLEWSAVQERVSEFATVIAYDRAGFGFSDPGPMPRTTDRILADLRAALSAMGAVPPYVLVAHSAGSYEMRLFAFQHREEVVGMVLVDPTGDRLMERSRGITPRIEKNNDMARSRLKAFETWAREGRLVPGSMEYNQCVPPTNPRLPAALNDAIRDRLLRPATWRAWRSEDCAVSNGSNDRILENARQILTDLPLIVLTREVFSGEGVFSAEEVDAFATLWKAGHEEHARLSTCGVRRDVPHSGHHIHVEQPELVAHAIGEVIAMGRP